MQIEELVAAFLAAQAGRLSPRTRRAYGYDLGLLAQDFPGKEAAAISVQDLRAFLNATGKRAPATVARRQAGLRACFGWAYREELIPADPTARLEPIRVPQRAPRPLSEQQVEALLKAIPADEKRDRLLFSLLAETGMRVGEALALQAADVHLDDRDGGYLRVVGKGDQERVVPLIDAPRTVRLLREWVRPRTVGPIFKGDPRKGGRPGEPLDYTTLLYHFERIVGLARARHPELFEGETGPLTIHRLRHTYATTKLREGVSLQSVRKLLGHRNIQTTLRYAETDLETAKRELVEARRRKR